MYGPILSVLLMGMIPVWNLEGGNTRGLLSEISVAAPVPMGNITEGERKELDALSASGVLIMDLESAQTVYARQADTERPMASLTKLMTALVIIEHHSLNEWVKIPANIEKVQGTRIHLPPNSEFQVGELLTGLLVSSANDAAVALAVHHSGSTEAFVADMNERAKTLGLSHTSYDNPAGLDSPGQHSTPREVALLALTVLRHPDIAIRMSTKQATIHDKTGKEIVLYHTHDLLHTADAIIAGKTGTTDEAGQCLLSITREGKRHYVVILLHSGDRYTDMNRVLSILES